MADLQQNTQLSSNQFGSKKDIQSLHPSFLRFEPYTHNTLKTSVSFKTLNLILFLSWKYLSILVEGLNFGLEEMASLEG